MALDPNKIGMTVQTVPTGTHRGYIGTWNNPPANNFFAQLDNPMMGYYKLLYAVWQTEQVTTTHIQWYIEFRQPVRFSRVQRLLPMAHIEVRRGTPVQAKDYCQKSESRIFGSHGELGTCPTGQGHRTDLDEIAHMIGEGKRLKYIAGERPVAVIKFHRGMKELINVLDAPKYRPDLVVKVFWGPTGSGKTYKVFKDYPDVFFVPVPTSRVWFDGYEQQPNVCFDDYRPEWMSSSMLLRLLDRYPMVVEVKGGIVPWNPSTIIMTTDAHPKTWFEDASTTSQVLRRISEVVKFESLFHS